MTDVTEASKLDVLKAPRDGSVAERTFDLGDVSAAPGERRRGAIFVTTNSNGEPIDMPIEVVHGAFAGPVIALGAGIHGDEYDSQQAVREVLAELDPATLHGTVVGMPCINTHAFAAATRVSGIDHANFNRIFPGDAEGTISYRQAVVFSDTLVPAVDIFIDLHTGGQFGEITPLVVVQRGYEDIAQELGFATGNRIVWKGGAWSGPARMSFLKAGKPAITVEAGGGTYRDDVVAHHAGSLRNILRHLRMIDGESVLNPSYPAVDATFARASVGGFYVARRTPGEDVKAGDVIAEIVDHFGEVRETVAAPQDGILLWVRRLRTVNPGEETMIFGPVEETLVP